MKGLVQQEERIITSMYTPNHRPSKYMKQKLTTEERNSPIIMLGDFPTPHSQ